MKKTFKPGVYKSTSLRKKGYDYSQAGWYFVTISTHGKEHYFGEVVNGVVRLNDMGKLAKQCWVDIPDHFEHVEIDEYVIMPDHIHGIISINGGMRDFNDSKSLRRDVACYVSTDNTGTMDGELQFWSRISPKPGSLGAIIRSYKSAVSRACHDKDFHNFRWQSNYYERIIRNLHDYQRIRNYIQDNPKRLQIESDY